jgi:hypothetical protein
MPAFILRHPEEMEKAKERKRTSIAGARIGFGNKEETIRGSWKN